MILAEIERRTSRRIAEMFDLIAGTSTGGILALGLTVPHEQKRDKPRYKASQLVSFYEEDGKEIFHSFWRDVVWLPRPDGGTVSLGADRKGTAEVPRRSNEDEPVFRFSRNVTNRLLE